MQRKPLIALLTNNDDDVYCFRKELIEALVNQGYDMLISCPYGEKMELMQHIPYIYDNPEIDRRGTNILRDIKLIFHYVKLLKKYKPDVILTYTAKPNTYATLVARIEGIPVINNVTGFGSVLKEKGIKKKVIMGLFRYAYRGSACIMFQNSTNMELAKNLGMVKGDYKLIPGSGVNVERYALLEYPEGGNGKKGETIVFNYIGRILKDKGVDDYIEVAKRIKQRYPFTEFNLIGFVEPTEMHYRYELEELERNGVVIYHGSQKDVRPYIQKSHAIIHPSVYGEGMSNVLLENASSGRPIITTNNPGCQETVLDGESGYIYQGSDIDELEQTVEKFLELNNNVRREMGICGRTYVEKNFSREKVINEYIDTIRTILGES